MADSFRLAVAILAAGASRRFGEADKLSAMLRGKPLGLHASDTLKRIHAQTRVVIAPRLDHPSAEGWEKAGFSLVANPNADEGMGNSVAVAARIARRAKSDALMIALADMPLVPRSHYQALADAAGEGGAGAITASSDGTATMPPAVFGHDHFDALADLCGDQGARRLLREAQTIACPAKWLTDIDTPNALSALESMDSDASTIT